jgi:hypothetical protein
LVSPFNGWCLHQPLKNKYQMNHHTKVKAPMKGLLLF